MATKTEPKTLSDLFEGLLQDIFSSENQLLKGMAKLSKAAEDPELKEAIETHMKETEGQIERIQQVAKMIDISAKGKVCQATVGLVKEAEENLEEFKGSPASDASIIASCQKNEHYEIANYGTAVNFANQLGYPEAAELLQQTLNEEKNTDQALTKLAESGDNQRALDNNKPPKKK